MASDIVFPKGNESAFIKMAKRLSYDSLCFVYSDGFEEKKKRIEKLQKKTDIALYIGSCDSKKRMQLFLHRSSDKDRDFFEKNPADLVFELERKDKDYMHSRDSGLNQVTLSLAKRNNIIIGFSFLLILSEKKAKRAQILGRIMQNIAWCRKFKLKTAIASFANSPIEMRNPSDLISFFAVLGMDWKDAYNGINILPLRIEENHQRAQGIPEGVKVTKIC